MKRSQKEELTMLEITVLGLSALFFSKNRHLDMGCPGTRDASKRKQGLDLHTAYLLKYLTWIQISY